MIDENFKFEITPNVSSEGDEVSLHEAYLMTSDASLTVDLTTDELKKMRDIINIFLDKEK